MFLFSFEKFFSHTHTLFNDNNQTYEGKDLEYVFITITCCYLFKGNKDIRKDKYNIKYGEIAGLRTKVWRRMSS